MNKEHNVDDTGMPAESDRNAWRKEMGRALEQRPNHLIQQHHQLANQCSPLEWRNSSNEQFPLPSPYYQYEMVSAWNNQIPFHMPATSLLNIGGMLSGWISHILQMQRLSTTHHHTINANRTTTRTIWWHV